MNPTLRPYFMQVAVERNRQEAKFPNQHLPSGTGPDATISLDVVSTVSTIGERAALMKSFVERRARDGYLTWRDVLYEEVLEAFAEADPTALRSELVQVAAVALRWIEDLDRAAFDEETTYVRSRYCETHFSFLSPQLSDPNDVCLARLVDRHADPGACRLVDVEVRW